VALSLRTSALPRFVRSSPATKHVAQGAPTVRSGPLVIPSDDVACVGVSCQPDAVLRIGLTGGIGAGKSTAAARFAARGAYVIDHDELARKVVAPGTAGFVDIVSEFGPRVLRGDELDRIALGEIVFADPGARKRLNEIVHPYVRAAAQARDRKARAAGESVVVHDIPLLVETGQGDDFDLVVTVSAPVPVRMARLQSSRGLTRDDAMARIQAQASDDERAGVADVVLDGSGTPEHLWAQVDEFWASRLPIG